MIDFLSRLENGVGLEITFWFHNLNGNFLYILLSPFHYLGSEIGFMILLPAVYWAINKEFGRRTTIILLGAQYFSIGFKYAFARPRPFHVAPERFNPINDYTQPGFPSGHTISGTVIGAAFARKSKQKTARILWILFIILMGFSRLVHGVHYPQDVLAGWIIGILWFLSFASIEKMIIHLIGKWGTGKKLLTTGSVSLAVLILIISIPMEFEAAKDLLSVSALLFGALLGIIIESRYLGFNTENLSSSVRIIRVIIGLGSLFSVYILLNFVYYAIVGESRAIWTQLLYYIRYGLIGGWATLGAPWLFLKAGKSQKR